MVTVRPTNSLFRERCQLSMTDFCTCIMKNSINYLGNKLWNMVARNHDSLWKMVYFINYITFLNKVHPTSMDDHTSCQLYLSCLNIY